MGPQEVPMSEIVRFSFPGVTDREGVDADACLAIFSAECLHGRPKTRLEVSYLIDATGSACVFRVGGEAGDVAVQVFLGLCSERFGETGFQVERLEREPGAPVDACGE